MLVVWSENNWSHHFSHMSNGLYEQLVTDDDLLKKLEAFNYEFKTINDRNHLMLMYLLTVNDKCKCARIKFLKHLLVHRFIRLWPSVL